MLSDYYSNETRLISSSIFSLVHRNKLYLVDGLRDEDAEALDFLLPECLMIAAFAAAELLEMVYVGVTDGPLERLS